MILEAIPDIKRTKLSFKNYDGDTRTSSKDFENFDTPKVEFEMNTFSDDSSVCDSSFAIADADLGENKESQRNEARISDKMNSKLCKTISNSFTKYFKNERQYGCN